MTQVKHTPGPWIKTYRPNVGEWWIGSKNDDPHLKLPISQMTCAIKAMTGNSHDEAEANAAFIVRACNNHYELVDALILVRKKLCSIADISKVNGPELFVINTAIIDIDGAITKTKGAA